MPYQDHVYVTFGGQLNEIGNLDEIWQCGVRVAPGDITVGHFTAAQNQTYLDEIAPTLRAWFIAPQQAVPNQANLAYVKVNNINAAGHYAGATTFEHLYSPPALGPITSQGAPAFCSVAYSWRAEVARGFGSHGRIYPPNFGFNIDRGSEITEGAYNQAAQGALDLLTLLRNGSGTVQATPIIASSTGASLRIARAGAGNIYDFQSRRKNHSPESYKFLPVTFG